MYSFKIKGGCSLDGTVVVKGAKNAVLPLMCASLLTKDNMVLENVSFLSDVETLIGLLKSLGVHVVKEEEKDRLILSAADVQNTTAIYEFVSQMRASFWVLGPLLARFGEAKVSLPGGCTIGSRPVDLYLKALCAMGAKISIENGYVLAKGPLHAATVVFPKISVGATHNTIMAAVLTPGVTEIHNPALEPEVMNLIDVLKKMGAKIEGVGTKTLFVTGVSELKGGVFSVIPDRIETTSFAVAAALTKGRIFIKGGRLDLMTAAADLLLLDQVRFFQESDGLLVDARQAVLKSFPITTAEYPAFPTDAQALFTTLLSISSGEAVVTESIFENRFMHVPELHRMGARIMPLSNHAVLIKGVQHLSGATVMASDLRGGVALVLAGLAAEGETTVNRIYHIDRGYYKLEEKLSGLGADIKRIRNG